MNKDPLADAESRVRKIDKLYRFSGPMASLGGLLLVPSTLNLFFDWISSKHVLFIVSALICLGTAVFWYWTWDKLGDAHVELSTQREAKRTLSTRLW